MPKPTRGHARRLESSRLGPDDTGFPCRIEGCENPPWSEARALRTCVEHYIEVVRHFQTYIREDGIGIAARALATYPGPRNVPHLVYFIQFGDRIKIGTTSNLKQRMAVLPHDRLIRTIPGGATVERQWHARFKHLRLTGEWFTAADELLEAIEAA